MSSVVKAIFRKIKNIIKKEDSYEQQLMLLYEEQFKKSFRSFEDFKIQFGVNVKDKEEMKLMFPKYFKDVD